MNIFLRNRIRERLRWLQSENGEALFEQVCAAVARCRHHANVKMSSFVAGRGDRGRDFENVPGASMNLVGTQGRADGIEPGDVIVGACTLGRSDIPAKVRSDVRTIHEGPPPKFIYFFSEADFPSTEQGDLQKWCEKEFGTRLFIITGKTLADWLCEEDLRGALEMLGVAASPEIRCVLPPVNTEGFVEREAELALLRTALIEDDPPAEGRIVGLHGSPGVGKSSLAVHFAWLHRDHFPDGVFGVDLRGVSDPVDALARLAVASGEPLTAEEQEVPSHQIAQARFGSRRCLLLLDNLEHGRDLKQIRPGGQASVLITSRNLDLLAQFAVAAHHRIPVGMFERPQSVSYLQRVLGSGHTPDEVDSLAEALRDLPLALGIGARLVLEDQLHRGRIGRFLARLSEPPKVIGELVVPGERDLDLGKLFELGIEHLSHQDRHEFACLSACNASDFGARAAAAATGRPDALPLLSRLARLSLVEVNQATSRFRFHPFVHEFAWQLAETWSLAPEARARHARAMADFLRSAVDPRDSNLAELLIEQEDVRHGIEHLVDIAEFDLPLLKGLATLVEQTSLGSWHLALLEKMNERLPEAPSWSRAVLLLQEGKRAKALGRLSEARAAFERCLAVHEDLQDSRGEAMALNSLGGVLRDLGLLPEARAKFESSLASFQALKDRRGEAMALNSLGGVLRDLGLLREARAKFEFSLAGFQALQDRRGEAMLLNSLGTVLRDLRLLPEARFAFERSLAIDQSLHNQRGVAMVLNSLGGVLRDLGLLSEAVSRS